MALILLADFFLYQILRRRFTPTFSPLEYYKEVTKSQVPNGRCDNVGIYFSKQLHCFLARLFVAFPSQRLLNTALS